MQSLQPFTGGTEQELSANHRSWASHGTLLQQAVLLDQFGVLHDGTNPYPDAIAAVVALADQVLKLLIVSNSSRRESQTSKRITVFPTRSMELTPYLRERW